MRHRKIPGKKGRYPTHYVELCPSCEGVMVKKFNQASRTYYKICQNCRLINDKSGTFQVTFTRGSELK